MRSSTLQEWDGRVGDRDERRLVDPEMVDRLISEAREQGVDVGGEGGLFAQLAKTVLERSLAAELTDHWATRKATRPASGRQHPQEARD